MSDKGILAVTWLKYCRYGVKLYPINQSHSYFSKNIEKEIKELSILELHYQPEEYSNNANEILKLIIICKVKAEQ